MPGPVYLIEEGAPFGRKRQVEVVEAVLETDDCRRQESVLVL